MSPPGLPCRGPLRNCATGRWASLACRNGHWSQVFCGCGRQDCEHCAEAVAAKRARRAYRRMGTIKGSWAVVVLTVPPALRSRIRPDELGRYWVAVWRCVERWALGVRYGRERLGGVGWLHPTGDDGIEWHPHWNVIIPLVAVDRAGVGARELPGWVRERRLEELRSMWARTLAEVLGVELPAAVDVFYEYRKDEVRKRHALRYFGRPFPGWSTWTRYTRWLGYLNGATWRKYRAVLEAAGAIAGDQDPTWTPCAECGERLILVEVSRECAYEERPGEGRCAVT